MPEEQQGLARLVLATGTLCYVPPGEFEMGSDEDCARPRERPAHRAWTHGYYIDQHPVTNELFARFCAQTSYRTTAERWGRGAIYLEGKWRWVAGASWHCPRGPGSSVAELLDHPVALISVGDANAFCAWRSRVEGRRFRLPTEAEWEKAARGTDGRCFPWGNAAVDEGGTLRARFNAGEPLGTASVAAHPEGASPYGVLELAGNVWEWCLDAFDEGYYAQLSGVHLDRGGPLSLTRDGVFRGGSWVFPREALRSSGRHCSEIVRPSAGIGFRCVHPLHDSLAIRAAALVRRAAFALHWWRWRLLAGRLSREQETVVH